MKRQKLVQEIMQLHADCIPLWKKNQIQLHQQGILRLVEENHAFNFQLWHAEDRARRDDQGFEFVYHAKREIDQCNQQRNNRMEAMDEHFFIELQPAAPASCPVHSETPGMMIDRLSILALKTYHMGVQATREDVDEAHQETCKHKLTILQQQRAQLGICLEELLSDVQQKTKTFRVYHQFKMYNDPKLNPELYHTAR